MFDGHPSLFRETDSCQELRADYEKIPENKQHRMEEMIEEVFDPKFNLDQRKIEVLAKEKLETGPKHDESG